MNRKMIAFDIDGTLLDSKKRPLDSTFEALKELRNHGHMITIATGRSRFHARDLILELGCANYILCNGAAAFMDHEQVYKNTLDKAALARFVEKADSLGIDTAFVGLDTIKRASSFNVEVMEEVMHSFGAVLPEEERDFYKNHDVYQALAYYDASLEGRFDEVFKEFRFVRWHTNSVDVVPNNGSKAATILNLAERVGIKKEDIIAFGDGMNDREMLKTAGIGVAMGNAAEGIQEIADLVTATNDEDGIWKALKELKLI